jgi:signal transduction histidine kinase
MAEVSEALRDCADVIAVEWDAAVREAMPNLPWNTTDRPQNHTPRSILVAIADSLESGDSRQMQRVIWESRIHGLARSRMNFEIRDIMVEDRLVRAITVKYVEDLLERHLEASEFRALSAAIDVMLQHAIFTVVDQQKAQLRKANETEHKHLAFLSHDLNNNLSNITLSLTHLRLEMESECAKNREALIRAEQLIINTVGGMKRLLEYERLRNSATRPPFVPVELRSLARKVAAHFAHEAQEKGLALSVEVSAGMVALSEPQLVYVILQNFVGNALKYSTNGMVRIGADAHEKDPTRGLALWVADEGPGIAPEHLEKIFEAFRRGDTFGKEGAGLGLAIASQAAKLLDAQLSVTSQVGKGSVFRVSFAVKSAEQPKG